MLPQPDGTQSNLPETLRCTRVHPVSARWAIPSPAAVGYGSSSGALMRAVTTEPELLDLGVALYRLGDVPTCYPRTHSVRARKPGQAFTTFHSTMPRLALPHARAHATDSYFPLNLPISHISDQLAGGGLGGLCPRRAPLPSKSPPGLSGRYTF